MLTSRSSNGTWLLIAGFAVVLYFCFRIVQPFLMPILFALILSTLLTPIFEGLSVRLKGRRTVAALLICIGLTLAILLPAVFLSIALAREANAAYQFIKDPNNMQGITTWLDPSVNPVLRRLQTLLPGVFTSENLGIGQIGTQIQQAGGALLGGIAATAAGVFGFVLDYFTMLVVLFFLLRDSKAFAGAIREVSPLPYEQERRFVETFRRVSRATVIGNLTTSLCQGAVGGLIFLMLGLPNPILWGALTALLSLVPVVGTSLVWVPWTLYLMASGSITRAIIFAILQVVLVGGIDNILRPLLMESHMRLHTLLVFFSIVGGISYFGLAGLFLGPLLFAMALAFLELYKEGDAYRSTHSPVSATQPEPSSDFEFDSED